MRERQIHIALKILGLYLTKADEHKGILPLHIFLQGYFRENKQMGSKDRKIASSLIYNYFRLGKSLSTLEPQERMAIGSFLCENEYSEILKVLFSSIPWFTESMLEIKLDEKVSLLKEKYPDFKLEEVFPFNNELSEGIDKHKFYMSFLMRPKLWIRIKRGSENIVIEELKSKDISFETFPDKPQTVGMEISTKLDHLVSKNKGLFEVQDFSSQLTGTYLEPEKEERWWDCCAGSGGKSLMLLDKEPKVKLFASDIRPQIIENLKVRFKAARINSYQAAVLDFIGTRTTPGKNFDGIIVDAPCSGSGTWGRTPEMLSLFDSNEINNFQQKQKNIAAAILPTLKSGKSLIYITCSVFKAENEDVVNYLCQNLNLKLDKMQLIPGYENRADSLFVARLIKSLP
ncbi:MAG: RsmB/NOP family class I SAM-dependent RNA methyltransferase [Bacteroidota bacterium]|nr:RsmB/NOP family class I SAM-dependent RNA methyltransferase [Bacteroidota bacterium]